MIRPLKFVELMPALSFMLLTSAAIGYSAAAKADEPPPASTAPQDQGGRHHNPAFAACKKQADDQNIAPGDARKEFIKNCLKSAPAPAPAPTTS